MQKVAEQHTGKEPYHGTGENNYTSQCAHTSEDTKEKFKKFVIVNTIKLP
jgi:hypothetical protein